MGHLKAESNCPRPGNLIEETRLGVSHGTRDKVHYYCYPFNEQQYRPVSFGRQLQVHVNLVGTLVHVGSLMIETKSPKVLMVSKL